MLFCCHPCCLHYTFCSPFTFYGTPAFLTEPLNPARYMATRQARKYFQEAYSVLEDLHTAPLTAATAETPSVAADAVSAILAVEGTAFGSSSTLPTSWKHLLARRVAM